VENLAVPNSSKDPFYRLRRTFAATLAIPVVLIGIAIPLFHGITVYRSTSALVDAAATEMGADVSRYAFSHPETWFLAPDHIGSVLNKYGSAEHAATRVGFETTLREKSGDIVHSSLESLARFSYSKTVAISDGTGLVGSLQVSADIVGTLKNDWVIIVMGPVGALIAWLLLFFLPMRIMDRVLVDLRSTQVKMALARDDAERANLAKSDFLSSMSHELRTPMNAIMGFTQMLGINPKEPLSETQKTATGHVFKSAEHLLSLIDDVLDFAKIEAGKMEVSIEDLYFPEVLVNSLEMVQGMATARAIKIQAPTVEESSFSVRADYTRLSQCFMNLLTNAVKYNREK
jgi:signal transduction histidine kinase